MRRMTLMLTLTTAILLGWAGYHQALGASTAGAAGAATPQATTPAKATTTAIKSFDELYPLDVDIVSGEKLVKVADQVIMAQDGRELRFNNAADQAKFKKDPATYLKKVDTAIIAMETKTYPLDTCIVSKDKLGGDMGKPVDFMYKNRLIRFCCPMCPPEFKKNPEKVLGELNQAIADKQRKDYPLDTCPVSKGKLGSMGDPLEYIYANQLVRFCCPDCLDAFKKDPQSYMKLISDARAAKTKADAAAPGAMPAMDMNMDSMNK
jgi:YHS domain-containing protein